MSVSKAEVISIINRFEWRFAKSMPQIPHWYTVKSKYNKRDAEDYEKLYTYIMENHYIRYFYGKPYKYCDIGDYSYWIMTDDIRESIIINRAKIEKGVNRN